MRALEDMRAGEGCRRSRGPRQEHLPGRREPRPAPARACARPLRGGPARRATAAPARRTHRAHGDLGGRARYDVQRLLDISRMDAGAVVADVRPFDWKPMLHRVARRRSRSRPRTKGFASRCGSARRPVSRRALQRSDAGRAHRAQPARNAVKYTRSGGVLLTCRLPAGPTAHWRIEVWDTGPGIAEADQRRIFDEFFQVERVPDASRPAGSASASRSCGG